MNAFPLPSGIRQVFLDDACLMPAYRIDTPRCRALVSAQGAQVLSFQAQGQSPLLWLSDAAAYRPGKAIRGGIPLCFPWFGPHPQDPAKPAHGFARTRQWHLQHAASDDASARLTFTLQDDAETFVLWPHRFNAVMTLDFGDTLAISLMLANTGCEPLACEFAWHSYFPVMDVRKAHLCGLENKAFFDQLKPGFVAGDPGALRFGAETDRIYTQVSGDLFVHDELNGSTITVAAEDCHSAIVWNPWAAKTATFADMAADAWQQMLCVERGNVRADAVVLPAGESRIFHLRLAQAKSLI